MTRPNADARHAPPRPCTAVRPGWRVLLKRERVVRLVPRTGAIALVLLATAAPAAEITVYRCTDADGAVSLQDKPCAATQTQERRALRAPDDPPASAQSSPSPSTRDIDARPGAESDRTTTPALRARRAPAPLYVCERHDGTSYESSTGVGERRWVPLWALGADPRAPADALDPATIGRTSPLRRTARDGEPALQVSAATLGTWVEDRCVALSPAQIRPSPRRTRRLRPPHLQRRAVGGGPLARRGTCVAPAAARGVRLALSSGSRRIVVPCLRDANDDRPMHSLPDAKNAIGT